MTPRPMITPTLSERQCRADFWLRLADALNQAGASPRAVSVSMPLLDVVELLAHNGIRMTYKREWHMDAQAKFFPAVPPTAAAPPAALSAEVLAGVFFAVANAYGCNGNHDDDLISEAFGDIAERILKTKVLK